ncbi:hypothetical protein FGB62_29g09 [Gracilaria domingensis]|nr:hypothetical protein FGB62_29g09 [Gracilaria domingensis]
MWNSKTEANDERLRRSQRRADANEWNNIMNIVCRNGSASAKIHDVKSLVLSGSLRVEDIVMQRTQTKTKMWENVVVSVDRTRLARGAPAVYLTHGELIAKREAAEEEAAKEEEDQQKRREVKAAEREAKQVEAKKKRKERKVVPQKQKLQPEEERQQKCHECERKRAATAQKRGASEEERKKSMKATGVVAVQFGTLEEGESEKKDAVESVNAFEEGKERSLAERFGLSERNFISKEDD